MRPLASLALLVTLLVPHARPAVQDAPPAASQGPPPPPAPEVDHGSRWIDPEDGWFDISRFLEEPAGFLPIAVPITEPALGYGVAGGAAFLQPRESAGEQGWARPNITFVGGMWTEDGSEGGFALDSRHWAGGDVQTLVGGGLVSLDLDYYGAGPDSLFQETPLEYVLDVWGAIGEGRVRLGESDLWAGLRFTYAQTDVSFRNPPDELPGISEDDTSSTLAGPTAKLRFDSLDNVFTPKKGTLAEASAVFYSGAFGGDRDFQLLDLVGTQHWPIAGRWFLGARADLGAAFGDTPFYMRPYIQQRGIPALRYQGDQVLSGELELRWQFQSRFSVLGFYGGGVTWSDDALGERTQDAFAGGGGVRYLVARRFGLHVGLDYAQGPDGGVIYVQFGSAWTRP
jgi:hypothetical protein